MPPFALIRSVTGSRCCITTVPIRQVPPLIGEYFRGLLRYARHKVSNHHAGLEGSLVEEFFTQRSKEQNWSDFADSSTEWYLNIMDASATIKSKVKASMICRVLDLGCGRSKLVDWLSARSSESHIQYLGVDIDRVAVEKLSEATHRNGISYTTIDLRRDTPSITGPFDIIFCINVLPYISDPSSMLTSVSKFCTASSLLVVIDPVPGPVWETDYGGFSIALRNPSLIASLCRQSGYRLEEEVYMCSGSVFKLGILPVSAMSVWCQEEKSFNFGGKDNHDRTTIQ